MLEFRQVKEMSNSSLRYFADSRSASGPNGTYRLVLDTHVSLLCTWMASLTEDTMTARLAQKYVKRFKFSFFLVGIVVEEKSYYRASILLKMNSILAL